MTDEQYMQGIKEKNHLAFQIITERYIDRATSFAIRMVGNRLISEEITQELFLKIWEKAYMWNEQKASFKVWFYSILKNLCIDYLKKKKESYWENLDLIEDNFEIIDKINKKEKAKIVKDAIDSLKKEQKSAIILFYYEELKIKEIAKIFNKSEKAIESLIIRARAKLKERLKNG